MAVDVISSPWTLAFIGALLLYYLSKTVQFYVKLCFYYFLVFFFCTVAIPIAALRPGEVENTNIVAKWMSKACSLIYGIDFVINGREYLADPTPCIVVGNHQSAIDVLGMMVVWPHLVRCVPMVKKELRYALSFGVFATLAGSVFIDRVNPEKARETVNKTVDYMKAKRTKLFVFPEGTRNSGGTMLPFKKGAFHLAIQGKLSILPMIFSEYSHVYNYETKDFQPGTITVNVLPPISTEGLSSDDVGDLAERVRAKMISVLEGKDEKEKNERQSQ